MRLTFLTFFTFRRDRARSVFGWTPGLQSILRGRILPCGCLTGVYDTCARELAEIVDTRHPACSNPDHEPDTVLWRRSPQALGPPVTADDPAAVARPA
jgi:hypothetical protein